MKICHPSHQLKGTRKQLLGYSVGSAGKRLGSVGYNPLILTIDPNFLGHPSIDGSGESLTLRCGAKSGGRWAPWGLAIGGGEVLGKAITEGHPGGPPEISLRKITRKMMPYLLEASDMLHGFLGKTSFFSVFMLQVQGYPGNEPRSLSESTVQEVFPSP